MVKSALLIIDMQNDLCYDARRKEKVIEMLPFLKKAINFFVQENQLVVYSYFALLKDDEQFKRFGDRYCIEGTHGAEIIPELFPLQGPTIKKRKHSAFFETELHDILQEAGVNTLYLAGLQTHICIMTTAADASFRGYEAIAIRECVISTQEDNKAFALNWIEKYVGSVKSLEEITKTEEVEKSS
jgi:nicotinamidase-related amidase